MISVAVVVGLQLSCVLCSVGLNALAAAKNSLALGAVWVTYTTGAALHSQDQGEIFSTMLIGCSLFFR